MSDPELQKFVSIESEWKTLNTAYASTEAADIPTQFRLVLTNAENANTALAGNQFGVAQVDISIAEAEIAEFENHNTILKDFTSKIHDDVVSIIDDPFNTAIGTSITNTDSINQAGYSQDEGGLNSEVTDIMSTINDTDNTSELDEANLAKMMYNLASCPERDAVFKCIQEAIFNGGSYTYIKNGYRYVVSNGKFKLIDVSGNTFRMNDRAGDFMTEAMKIAAGKGSWDDYKTLVRSCGVKLNRLDAEDVAKNLPFNDYIERVAKAGGSAKKYRLGCMADAAKGSVPFMDVYELAKAAKKGEKLTGAAKTVKAIGIIGDVITIGTDIADNVHVDENGKVDVKTLVLGSAVDIAVDTGSGAVNAAIGAAVGSFIIPPLGTIVGAAVGIGIDYVMNKDFDLDGDGESHSVVGSIKSGLHGLFGIG